MLKKLFSKTDSEKTIIKSLLKLAGPIILANILQVTYNLTDAFWVGRLGEKAVASIALSAPIIFLLVSLGIGLSVAGSILIAQYFGAKNEKMVNFSAGQTILMVTIAAIVLSILGVVLSPFILHSMNAPVDIYNYALQYLQIAFLSLLPNFCFFMFQSIMRSIGRPSVPLYIIISTVLLNFILDPLFMFGFAFIPRMEIVGVAIATTITQVIAAIIGLSILFSGKKGIHLKLKDLKPDFKFIKKAFFLGLPTSLEQSARSLAMVVITSLIATFGTLAVASYGVGGNIIQIIIILSMGLSMATSVLAGQSIGSGDRDRAEKITLTSGKISFIILSLFGVLVYFLAPNLIAFFVPKDANIINLGSHFLKIVAFTFGLIGIQMSVSAILQASGNTLTSMLLTISSQWLIQIPLALLLSKYFNLGTDGIWYSFPLTNFIISIIYILVFKSGHWKKKKIIHEGHHFLDSEKA